MKGVGERIAKSYSGTKSKPKVGQTKISPQTIERHRQIMDNMFRLFNLKTLSDFLQQPVHKMKRKGAIPVFKTFKENVEEVFKSLYPHYPWDFNDEKLSEKGRYFSNIERQLIFMEKTYKKLNLKSLGSWEKISKKVIIREGGRKLLKYYKKNKPLLLLSLYPNYPWKYRRKKKKKKEIAKIDRITQSINRRAELVYERLKLTDMEQWYDVSRWRFKLSGGSGLLAQFDGNMTAMLASVFPNYPWVFDINKRVVEKLLLETIRKYKIKQKKDWYRIRVEFDSKFELVKMLKDCYPEEEWNKRDFVIRTKKSTQRLLYSQTQEIYGAQLILEDYDHPKFAEHEQSVIFELDLFIPALQLAVEYQGEQHYDDIPAAFGILDASILRDQMKRRIASLLSIKIVYIPYWWDQSLSSLRSALTIL